MSLAYISGAVIPATAFLLPPKMESQAARAMLMAIGLQESRFTARTQDGGPARGFWQFERGGGVKGVLNHSATQPHINKVLDALEYDRSSETSYQSIADNDILACAFARLLLWTLPGALPGPSDPNEGWQQYMEAWKPGKPHRETWDAFYQTAWELA